MLVVVVVVVVVTGGAAGGGVVQALFTQNGAVVTPASVPGPAAEPHQLPAAFTVPALVAFTTARSASVSELPEIVAELCVP